MGRKAKANTPAADDGITEAGINAAQAQYDATSAAIAEINHNAKAVALSVGYEGGLTVGSIEDEIRFYQRQTIEACLELGKRLLVLKELTAHGEFEKRLVLLGLEKTKAHRFMKAAGATAKSCNLQLLSERTKSFSTFWEIVMSDDEVVENILEWDDIEKMSAPALRLKLRDMKADAEATENVLSDKQDRISDLERQLKRRVVAMTDWPEAIGPMLTQVEAAQRAIEQAFSDMHTVIETSLRIEVAEAERPSMDKAFEALGLKIDSALSRAQALYNKTDIFYQQSIAGFVPDSASKAKDAA